MSGQIRQAEGVKKSSPCLVGGWQGALEARGLVLVQGGLYGQWAPGLRLDRLVWRARQLLHRPRHEPARVRQHVVRHAALRMPDQAQSPTAPLCVRGRVTLSLPSHHVYARMQCTARNMRSGWPQPRHPRGEYLVSVWAESVRACGKGCCTYGT